VKHTTIEGANAHPGAPKGWDPEQDGICGVLPVRVTWSKNALGHDTGRAQTCESAWVPSPEELATLNRGGTVRLVVAGWQVPVSLHVDPPLPVAVLAYDGAEAEIWYNERRPAEWTDCYYVANAEAALGRHFSRFVEVLGFERRHDATALREVVRKQIRPHLGGPEPVPATQPPSIVETGQSIALLRCSLEIACTINALAKGEIDIHSYANRIRGSLLTFETNARVAAIKECDLVAEIALAKTTADR
jgi:hypothetical protein